MELVGCFVSYASLSREERDSYLKKLSDESSSIDKRYEHSGVRFMSGDEKLRVKSNAEIKYLLEQARVSDAINK